jgi:ribosome-associated heat shock protein Hsp15
MSAASHAVRIDKWLWAARFFKTRALAARACELGRVEIAGQGVKPSREVRVGDKLKVTNDSGDYQIEVMRLSEMRGPASVAQGLYSESEENRALRLKAAAERKAAQQFESLPQGGGRPTKRDRRKIIDLRGGF